MDGMPHRGSWSPASLLFSVVILGYCGWILSLPVFPSQDGPAHLYYADVLSQLLFHAPVFSSQYQITHLLPPYALQNYLLVLLLHWFSPVLAEKSIACLCVILTGYGFRYFANRLGPSGDGMALLASPFFLHVYLFLGFYNYCMAVGLAFWAMGTWLQTGGSPWRRRIGFLCLVLLTTLTHPVPVLLILAFCGAAWGLNALTRRGQPRQQVADLATLAVASTSLIFIGRFVDRSTASPVSLMLSAVRQGDFAWARLLLFVRMAILSPITLTGYRYALLTMVLLILAAALWSNGRDLLRRNFTAAQLSLAGGLLIAALLPLLPSIVNGSGFLFADRLTFPCVLLIMASGASLKLGDYERTVTLAGAVCGILALLTLQTALGPVARLLVLPEHPVARPGQRTWIVNVMNLPAGLSFNPCTTAGARILQQEKRAWLNNPPWLGLSITMLKAKGQPADLFESLRTDPQLALVLVHCGGPDDGITDRLQSRFPGRWTESKTPWANLLRPKN